MNTSVESIRISTENLTYQYPDSDLLSFPDIRVDKAQSFLVSGESGCGKSTFLHLLAGLRKAKSGNISIDNTSIENLSPMEMDQYRGVNIGLVFQEAYFVQSLTVLENMLISPYAGSVEKAKEIANRLKISDQIDKYSSKLSTGQQQRANIARAVMNKPKVILADEPTSALDNKNCAKVIDLLQEEAINNNAALIIVTHDDRLKSEISHCVEI